MVAPDKHSQHNTVNGMTIVTGMAGSDESGLVIMGSGSPVMSRLKYCTLKVKLKPLNW